MVFMLLLRLMVGILLSVYLGLGVVPPHTHIFTYLVLTVILCDKQYYVSFADK